MSGKCSSFDLKIVQKMSGKFWPPKWFPFFFRDFLDCTWMKLQTNMANITKKEKLVWRINYINFLFRPYEFEMVTSKWFKYFNSVLQNKTVLSGYWISVMF
ncbi:unnamed protein product [Rhizophagus irregularis]|nr:unnamed protein product [Rhizophagus irregularis]